MEEEVEANLSAGDGEEEEEEARAPDGASNGSGGGGLDFDPTEDELVLHFLRPQLRGFPPRVAGAVLEADPCGALPPWELLARYGLRQRGHFFAARRGRGRGAARRSVAGVGTWMHSATKRAQSVTDLGVVVRWSRVKFCFYVSQPGPERQLRSAGWVLEEYQITDPRCYRRADEEEEEDRYWVLCRVRRSGNHGRRTMEAGAGAATPPTPGWNSSVPQ